MKQKREITQDEIMARQTRVRSERVSSVMKERRAREELQNKPEEELSPEQIEAKRRLEKRKKINELKEKALMHGYLDPDRSFYFQDPYFPDKSADIQSEFYARGGDLVHEMLVRDSETPYEFLMNKDIAMLDFFESIAATKTAKSMEKPVMDLKELEALTRI